MKAPNLHHSLSKSMHNMLTGRHHVRPTHHIFTLRQTSRCLGRMNLCCPHSSSANPMLRLYTLRVHFPRGDFQGLLAYFIYMDHTLASPVGQNHQPLWPHFCCLPADLLHRSTSWRLEGQCAANRCSTRVSLACLRRS